jgi:hypothetical protein
MAPEHPRTVILDLRSRPASVDVTAQADGSLLVVTPAGGATVAPPASLDVPWQPRTAHAAARAAAGRVDRMERSSRRWRRCAPRSIATCSPTSSSSSAIRSATRARAGWPSRVRRRERPRPTSTVHRGAALASTAAGRCCARR